MGLFYHQTFRNGSVLPPDIYKWEYFTTRLLKMGLFYHTSFRDGSILLPEI